MLPVLPWNTGRGGFLNVNAASIAWLQQEAISGSKKTVFDEATSQMKDARQGFMFVDSHK